MKQLEAPTETTEGAATSQPRVFPAREWGPVLAVVAASGLAWLLLFLAVPPVRQNFPLNDDWAFARGALLFSQGQGIHYGGWASMAQLGQWLWACPFVWLLGPSHVALRLATVVLSWLGLWAFYDLLRQHDWPPRRAALGTAALAFNPLFFLLQGTFMTDVPTLSLALLSLALYGRAFQGRGVGWLVGGCVLGVLAAITRQNAAAVSAVAAILLLRQVAGRGRSARWWLPVLLPGLAGVLVHFWLQERADIRPREPARPDPADLSAYFFAAAHLCGLSVLPLLPLGGWAWSRQTRFALAAVLALLQGCAVYVYSHPGPFPYPTPPPDAERGLFPYTENMLTPWGAFAGSASTGSFMVGQRPLLLGRAARIGLTVLGCCAAAVWLVQVGRAGRRGAAFSPLVLFALLQIPFLGITRDLYDRYLLFLFPGALALAAWPDGQEDSKGARTWLGLAGVAVFAVVSVGLMHDWLAWNGARWELGRRALAHRIPPLAIEGGVEWDGWWTVSGSPAVRHQDLRWRVLPFTREWFPGVQGRYVLSFTPQKGARRLDAEPYRLWLAPGEREFYLLETPPLPTTPPD